MIIGNNNNNNRNNNFIKNYSSQHTVNNNDMQPLHKNPSIIHENKTNMQHSNIMDKNEMNNKAFSMLQERLSNGTISIEEFNKKCIELGKHSK